MAPPGEAGHRVGGAGSARKPLGQVNNMGTYGGSVRVGVKGGANGATPSPMDDSKCCCVQTQLSGRWYS